MKKTALYILIAVFIIVLVLYVNISNAIEKQKKAEHFNNEYEIYLDKELSGTDIATIINRAIENNEKNSIPKDEKGFYLNDDEKTIKVELNMISYNKEGEIIYNTFQMEAVNALGITNFLANYNTANFRCSKIEYHQKTGQVSKIVIEQNEEKIG